jgi:hypothetical protein
MRLQMRGVDHDPLRLAALARQFGENPVEHAQTTPANEPIVDRFVWPVFSRRVAPAKSVLDHKPDGAHDQSTRAMPCDSGKYRSIRRICAPESRNKSDMAKPPRLAHESANSTMRKKFNRS